MKTHIITHGCTANKALSEKTEGERASLKNAELVIINSCALKTPTENQIIKEVRKIEKKYPNKKIIVTGCLAEAFPNHPKLKRYYVKIDKLLSKSRERKNKRIGIVRAAEGCLGNCTFCAGKLAKGSLNSRPERKILEEVKNAAEEGCNEIYLTSQDMGCYGFDKNTNLVELLKKVVRIQGDFWIRIGMMNPNHIIKFVDDLVELYKSEKIYKFLHIPVQSGSNKILNSMNRKYKIEDFKKIVKKFRKEIPKITISTDIIVGFPGESKEDFQRSVNLIKNLKPDILNLTRYWPRKGTRAASMEGKLHSKEKKERSRKLTKIFNKISLEKNKEWIGESTKVLINSEGKHRNQYKGRNIFYKPVVVKSGDNLMGRKVKARVCRATKSCLLGEII